MSAVEPSGGTIHDLGYRRYTGQRLGVRDIGWSMFATSLGHAYGIGRSAKAKILPWTLQGIMVLPAVIVIAIMVVVSLAEGFVNYSSYPLRMMLILVIFVAAQAPIIFSRDLVSGALSLYLARPLGATAYAVIHWAALVTAVFGFILLPVTAMYIGALSAGADVGKHTGDYAAALVGDLLLAMMLATLAGLISAYTTRRILAVGGTIVALLVTTGVSQAIRTIATDRPVIAEFAGLLSPFAMVDGIQAKLLGGTASVGVPPSSFGMTLLYVVVAAAVIGGGLLLLIGRYRRLGAR